jgi:ketosteroid isomerase-like protein
MRQHDVEKGVSFYAKDCVIDIVPLEQPIRGREGLAAAWRMAWSGFPDTSTTKKTGCLLAATTCYLRAL